MATSFFPLLTVCGIPELEAHGGRGVTHVLSILDPTTPEPDFGAYGAPARTVLRFDDIVDPEPGKVMPRRSDVEAILRFGEACRDGTPAEGHLLVHCHAGISRSTAAMTILMAQADPEASAASLTARLLAIRPQAWPNLRLVEFGDELLGRGGRLVAAVADIYRARLEAKPELAESLLRLGRGAELALAQGAPAA